jgi:hypothetical protein
MQMPMVAKAVYISLADNANDHGVCWPSIPTIAKRVCAAERTVFKAIKWLEENQLLVKEPSQGKSTRYKLTPEQYAPLNDVHPCTTFTQPLHDVHPTPAPRAVDPCTTFTQTVIEPSEKHKRTVIEKTQSVIFGNPDESQNNHKPLTINQNIDKPAKSGLVNLFHGVSDEVKNDFIALRKAKKAPVTATAIKGIEREAIKAKLTLEQALEICCSNGWTGFKADWLQKTTKQAESFYERDQRLAAERMAEIGTGLVAAKPPTWTPTEIDDDGTFIPF